MKTVDVEEEALFNKFLKGYLEAFAWLLTPSAMLFMKFYISLNIYDFFIASFALLVGLYLLSLNKVIYFVFKVYSGFCSIADICEEICYNWARRSKNSYGKVVNTVKFSIKINRNYPFVLRQVRSYTSFAHLKDELAQEDNNGNIFDDKDIGEKENEFIMDNNELSNKVNNKLESIKFNINVSKNNVNTIINNKIKELHKEKKDAIKKTKGGYYSYNKNICVLGSLQFLLNKGNLISCLKDKMLSQLNGDDLYSLLVNIQYVSNKDGSLKGTSPMASMVVTGKANPVLISERIHNGLRKAYDSYDMKEEGIIVSVHWKDWIPKSQYEQLVGPVDRTQIVNRVLEEEAKNSLPLSGLG